MFKRKTPLTKLQLLCEVFWPSMGWRRAFKYMRHRIIRLADSSKKIAAGMALGASISFTPLVGTHFIQAGVLAHLTGANVPASLVGNFVGNPWTFPFMWWAAISLGSFLFGLIGLPTSTALPEHVDFQIMWQLITHEPLRIFLPWLLGGYLIALLAWPLFFLMFLNIVRAGKKARRKAKLRKVHKTAMEMTSDKTI